MKPVLQVIYIFPLKYLNATAPNLVQELYFTGTDMEEKNYVS